MLTQHINLETNDNNTEVIIRNFVRRGSILLHLNQETETIFTIEGSMKVNEARTELMAQILRLIPKIDYNHLTFDFVLPNGQGFCIQDYESEARRLGLSGRQFNVNIFSSRNTADTERTTEIADILEATCGFVILPNSYNPIIEAHYNPFVENKNQRYLGPLNINGSDGILPSYHAWRCFEFQGPRISLEKIANKILSTDPSLISVGFSQERSSLSISLSKRRNQTGTEIYMWPLIGYKKDIYNIANALGQMFLEYTGEGLSVETSLTALK